MAYRMICTRDLKGTSYSGINAHKVYESGKEYHLSKTSPSYGDVLASTKRIRDEWSIKIRFFRQWRGWRPEYCRYDSAITWLFFQVRWGFRWDTIPDKVVKDHLGEQEAAKAGEGNA